MKKIAILTCFLLLFLSANIFAAGEKLPTVYLPPPIATDNSSKAENARLTAVWDETIVELRKENLYKILNISVDTEKGLPMIKTIGDPTSREGYKVLIITTGPRAGARSLSISPTNPGFKSIFQTVLRAELKYLTRQNPAQTISPTLLDEFDFARLDQAYYAFPVANFRPSAIVEGPDDDSIFVAAGGGIFEMTSKLEPKRLIGAQLLEQGIFYFATGLTRTPTGSLYAYSSLGSDMYTFFPGNPNPSRTRSGKNSNGILTVLPDGSKLTADSDSKPPRFFLTQDNLQTPLKIPYTQIGFGFSPIPGPGNTLFIYDYAALGFWQYTLDGDLKDFIPLEATNNSPIVKAPRMVYDGHFLTATPDRIQLFRTDGSLEWQINMAGLVEIFLDSTGSRIYTIGVSDSRIKVYYLSETPPSDKYEKGLLDFNKALEKNPNNLTALKGKASLYKSVGSQTKYRTILSEILEKDPNDQNIRQERETIEIELSKRQAAALDNQTREKLALGSETARNEYSKTMALYERILKINPSDTEVLRSLRNLKAALKSSETRYDESYVPLSMEPKLDNVFPALFEYYKSNPIGTLTVKNPLTREVKDVEVFFNIPNYSIGPSRTVLKSIKPGETVKIPFKVDLLASVLEIQENIPVNGSLLIKWNDGDTTQKMDSQVSLQIFRRTAMTWDQAARLASFITPNEETVSTFAGRAGVTNQNGGFSEKILRASRIVDTLGIYGIRYTPDPNYPITRVQVEKSVIDTVRFPRTTLYQKSGDCDDTTALLCSLFEAVGINTSIVTTPGHVFMAFDTGEPEENFWIYSGGEREVIKADGKLWIPLETTILNKGFAESWKIGSDLIKSYGKDKDYSFTPVYFARKDFPALTLAPETMRLDSFDQQAVEALDNITWGTLKDTLYVQALTGLERQAAGQSGKALLKSLNRLAALHNRFGQNQKSEEALRKAIALDGTFSPSYVNLAALLLQQTKAQEALVVLLEGYKKAPDSVYINLGLAQTYNQLGKPAEGTKYFDMVKKNAPDLANRFALAAGQSTSNQRAGTKGSNTIPLWAEP